MLCAARPDGGRAVDAAAAEATERLWPAQFASPCQMFWLRHCLREIEIRAPASVCEASGEPFPPEAPGWEAVFQQRRLCSNEIWKAEYAEVRWSPGDFQRWAPWARGSRLPSVFGLCFQLAYCQPSEVKQVLVPLFWWYRLVVSRRAGAAGIHDAIEMLRVFLSAKDPGGYPGRVRLLMGRHHGQAIYTRTMLERASFQPLVDASGVFCIVGMPRSFVDPTVHEAFVRNLVGALNFTESQNVFLMDVEDAEGPAGQPGATSLQGLLRAFHFVHPHVLVTNPPKPEGDPPHRRCNESWTKFDKNCNAQFRSLELCMDIVKQLEVRRGAPFDWVVRVRPDTLFNTSMGPIRAYDPDKIHALKSGFSEVWDGFAIIPRRFADVYFATRFSAATEYCWVSSKGRRPMSGQCEWRLDRHLRRQGVPVEPIPRYVFDGKWRAPDAALPRVSR